MLKSIDQPIAVAFIDDHPVLLEGIEAIFERDSRFKVIGKGDCADQAIAIFASHRPDLMFLDLSMPGDTFAAIKAITASGHTKVLVYTAYTDIDMALKSLDNGASAFVVKDSISNELFDAVEAVLRGELFISHSYAGRVLGGLRNRTARASAERAAKLSLRERQVVALLLQARSNKEIANDLSISEKTVKHYMTNLMTKMNARNRVAVALAAHAHLDNA